MTSVWLVSEGKRLNSIRKTVPSIDETIKAAEAELAQKLPTPRIKEIFENSFAALGEDFFIRSGVGFLREAYVCYNLALHLNAPYAQLLLDREFPDFRIFDTGSEQDFECTEVMDPKRQRGDEYRLFKKQRADGIQPVALDIAGHLLSEDDCADAIRNRCAEKIKLYGKSAQSVGLAVYLNDFWPPYKGRAKMFHAATSDARKVFRRVYIVTGSHVYRADQERDALISN